MDYAQYLQKIPFLEFENFLMIKSISYKRKSSSLLEESPRNRYMSFIVEKNRTCFMEVTMVPFIIVEVPFFMQGENVHISTKYICLVRIKYI